jgi:hypothetical protein
MMQFGKELKRPASWSGPKGWPRRSTREWCGQAREARPR